MGNNNTTEFDKRSANIRKVVEHHKGKVPKTVNEYGVAKEELIMGKYDVRTGILEDMKTAVRQLDALRAGDKDNKGIDISMATYVQDRWGFAMDDKGNLGDGFLHALNINPSHNSIGSLMSMPDIPEGYRWLVPEIVREAIRAGLRKQPIYGDLIAAEETVTQPSVTMPIINLSDTEISRIGETETIRTGTVAFDKKTVSVSKIGTGIKLSDEIIDFVSLNLLSIYLQDVGVNIGIGLDALALDTLINGDNSDVKEPAPVIGVKTRGSIQYYDLLRAWIRLGRLGRTPNAMVSDETMALDILTMDEFKGIYAGTQTLKTLNLKTPIPNAQNFYVHGAMPLQKLMLVNSQNALIKLNVGAMRMENERIAERQLSGTYVSMTTGFANLFRDSRLIIDAEQEFDGFPEFMNIDEYEKSTVLLDNKH